MPLFLFIFALTLITTVRLFYSIDFTDESYWIAMALRFANGDRPFVDELFVNQTGSLLFTPFIKTFLYVTGSTDGIVLYTRLLYLLFSLTVSAIVFRALKERYSATSSALAASAAFLILPLNIPNLGYDSLGSGLFTAGVFSFLLGVWTSRFLPLFLAGVFHGVAAFAYPTLIFPICSLVFLSASLSPKRLRTTALYTLGGVLVAVALAPVFLQAHESFPKAMRYSVTAYHHGGGLDKLLIVLRHMFWENVSPLVGVWTGFTLLALLFFPASAAWLVFLLPLFLFLSYVKVPFTQMWFVFYFALLAPLISFFSRRGTDRDLFRFAWLPSWIAAVTIGWTSLSAPINGVLGFVPAFIAGAIFLSQAIHKTRLKPVFLMVLCALLLVQQFNGKAFYRDGNFSSLTARVPEGPYRGLFTTQHKLRYLEEITRDIHHVENPNGRIVFYEFPAGYLISTMKIGSNSAWMRDVSRGKQYYLQYYGENLSPNDRVFEIHWLTHERERNQWVRYGESDPFHRFLRETHEPILRKESYTVLAPRSKRD